MLISQLIKTKQKKKKKKEPAVIAHGDDIPHDKAAIRHLECATVITHAPKQPSTPRLLPLKHTHAIRFHESKERVRY